MGRRRDICLFVSLFKQAWQRYRNAKEEQAIEESARARRWGGDRYGGPPSPDKGVDSMKRDKMVRVLG